MNKNLVIGGIVVLILIGGVAVYASQEQAAQNQEKAAMKEQETAAMEKAKDPAMMDDTHILGVVLSHGTLMTVWEGNVLAALTHDAVLKNGTTVHINGSITDTSGKTVTLKEGQELTADGSIVMVDVSKLTMMKKESSDAMVKKDTAMVGTHGTYEAYSLEKVALASATHKVILFFRAGWCPTCRALDADIKAHLGDIPANVTILDVDYDNSTDLKMKYGVRTQHTLVEVNAQGTLIQKWLGSPTLTDLVTHVK